MVPHDTAAASPTGQQPAGHPDRRSASKPGERHESPAAPAACQHAAGWRLRRKCRSGIFPHRSSRPGDGPPRRQEDAMSVFQPDTESGQPTAHGLPAFQVVRRGYDPTQGDTYIPQLIARLEEAEQVRTEVTGKAQTVLAEAEAAAERVRQEVEQERAALDSETQQVREFRDGLLEDL